MTPATRAERDIAAHALLNEIVAAHAATLARRGEYSAAEELILPVITSGSETPQLLDLLARIRVQQGRMSEAASLWRDALARDTGNSEFRAALGCVTRSRYPAARRVSGMMIVALGAILLIITGIAVVARPHASATAPIRTSKHQKDLSPILPSAEQFDSPNTNAVVGGGSIKIGFTQPVFAHDARVTAYGMLVLSDFATKLRPFSHDVDLTIIGKTDGVPVRSGGRYSDNSVLGMERALAAYNQLRRHIPDLPLPRLTAEANAHRGDWDPNQRTVAILLTAPPPQRDGQSGR